jgi:hypothetical protein
MTASTRSLFVLLAAALVLGCGRDKQQRMLEAEKRLEADKKKYAKEAEAKLLAAAPKVERATLEAPWEDPNNLRVTTGKPCPDGLWSLFESTPGEGSEQEANARQREALATKLRAATFVTTLGHGSGVTVHPWDKKKKSVTVEVEGLVECFDKLGLLSLAWGQPAKAFRPSPADEAAMSPQAVWRARSLSFGLPFATEADAKAWSQKEGLTAEARVVFTVGKVEVDKRVKKNEQGQEIDWGAGRLAHVELVGVRLATNFEKTLLVERRRGEKDRVLPPSATATRALSNHAGAQ